MNFFQIPEDEGSRASILTESGFMDSRYDAALLISDEYIEKVAVAHEKAICEWANAMYTPE